ncbi:MAG: radical SAM family heme chaperone HemW [Rhodomicrobium sp.]
MTKTDAGAEPLAVYIHWPYCQSKCPYCDFNSYARRSITEAEYVHAAIAELCHYAQETAQRTVTSVFFGGGTPSLIAPADVGALLDEIAALWPVDPAAEITLEANPSSVEAGRFAGYRAAGVNRVSLGVQSLNDDELRFLGRLHTAAEARHALKIAAQHFARVNFDLIYARPGQEAQEWRAELIAALGLSLGHLSLYQLTIEPETAFFDLQRRGKLRIPGAELAAGLYDSTQEICEAAGLPAYEVSNHASPGEESRHNLTYWRYGDYIGVGPGAHGRITVGHAKFATAAIKAPQAWAAQISRDGHGCAERVELSACEQAEEMVLMGLRLSEGMDFNRLQERTGYSLPPSKLSELEEEGLLLRQGTRVRVTARGRLVLNAIAGTLAAGLIPNPE